MRTSATSGYVCAIVSMLAVLAVGMVASSARADTDYYQSVKDAEQASASGAPESGLRLVDSALQSYPKDYALTLLRARLLLRLARYSEAEQSYRDAAAVSDGSIASRVGLGWALQAQGDCAAATAEFRAVLAVSPEDADAQRGVALCQPTARLRGSAWLTGGGALFREHPWKRIYGDLSGGFTLLPAGKLSLGAAYHFLNLAATDRRVAGVRQHELYIQAGVAAQRLQILAHGALVWSGDPQLDGSVHAGMSGRYYGSGHPLEDASLELTASRYPDGWAGRAASAWRFALGMWSITPGLAFILTKQESFTAASMSFGINTKALSVWVSGKYGPEYRAAYLTQFALLNSEDRSVWSISAGGRLVLSESWILLAGYLYLRMKTPDGVPAGMHLANAGLLFVF